MRVAFMVEQCRARVPGGAGRYTAEVARSLEANRVDDDQLTGWVAESSRGLDLPLPIRSLHTHPLLLARLWERDLGPTLRDSDVVHAPTLLVPPVRKEQRLVVTIHDVVPWTHPETLTPRGVRFHQRMGTRAAREASVIITPTRAVADQVREVLAPRGEVVCVHPGRTTLSAPADAASRRHELGLSDDPYILFVGTAEPRKGLDVLLDAMAQPELRGRRLVVAGPQGWGQVDVRAEATARGLDGAVCVTGRVSDEDLAALYAGASVVAMPSRAEGFGLPVLEAMTLGVPVVTSDDPALVEVGRGATVAAPVGDVAALAERLATVSDDARMRSDLADRGRARSRDFDWATTARQLWDVYLACGQSSETPADR